MDILIITLLGLIFLTTLLLVFRKAKTASEGQAMTELMAKIDYLDKNINRFEALVKEDFRQNREELNNNLSRFQQTVTETLREMSRAQIEQLTGMSEQNQKSMAAMNKTLEDRLTALIDKNDRNNKENREELGRNLLLINEQMKAKADEMALRQKEQHELTVKQMEAVTTKLDEKLGQLTERMQLNAQQSREAMASTMKEFQESFSSNVKDFNELQKQKFGDLEKKQAELITSTATSLEKMRETVDEKLQKTLEQRLGQSFELVSKQLESVQKGLGEMQTLAQDVGGLKRVLSNVKTRGVMGEIQLGNILEQIMAPEQYETNVKTKKSSGDHVEYAIKLPGRDQNDGHVYLPVDAKFPQEAYHLLQLAYDEANTQKVDEATKTLVTSIRKFAKDISDKYLDPPYTTDFGIMFLPIEGLYAEVVRNTDLMEQLQREYKIIVTGPTTLAAILNSLQMGFKTLAIQKRSSEVWQILGAVKTEFGKFGGILEKARKKIDEAGNDIDTLVGTRSRAIQRRLRQVQELPSAESSLLLGENILDEDPEEASEV